MSHPHRMLTDTELSNFRTFLTRHGGIPLKEFGPQGAFDSAPEINLRTAADGERYARALMGRMARRRYPGMAFDESDYEGAKGVAGALIPGAESLVPDRKPAGAMDDDDAIAQVLAFLASKLSDEDLEQARKLLQWDGTSGPRDDTVGSSSPGGTRNWAEGYQTHDQACDEWARISRGKRSTERPLKGLGQDNRRRPQSTSFDVMFPTAKKIRL